MDQKKSLDDVDDRYDGAENSLLEPLDFIHSEEFNSRQFLASDSGRSLVTAMSDAREMSLLRLHDGPPSGLLLSRHNRPHFVHSGAGSSEIPLFISQFLLNYLSVSVCFLHTIKKL